MISDSENEPVTDYSKSEACGMTGWAVHHKGYTYFVQRKPEGENPNHYAIYVISDKPGVKAEVLHESDYLDTLAVFNDRIYFVQRANSYFGNGQRADYELMRLSENGNDPESVRAFPNYIALLHTDENWLYYYDHAGGEILRMNVIGTEEAVRFPGKPIGIYKENVYYTKFLRSDEETLTDYYGGLYRFSFDEALANTLREYLVCDTYEESIFTEAFNGTARIIGDSFFFPAGRIKSPTEKRTGVKKFDLETGELTFVRVEAPQNVEYDVYDDALYYFDGKSLYRTAVDGNGTERLIEESGSNDPDDFFYDIISAGDWLYYKSYTTFPFSDKACRFSLRGGGIPEEGITTSNSAISFDSAL
jgi:hypothetical protein